MSAAMTASYGLQAQTTGRLFAFVGCWTDGINGAGINGGVHVFAVDGQGALTPVMDIAPEVSAGFLCVSPDNRFLYCTDERKDRGGSPGAGGSIFAFAIDRATGRLTPRNSVASMGAFPAFVAMAPDGRHIAVANHASYDAHTTIVAGKVHVDYDDATVALFPLHADGSVAAASSVAVLEPGSGEGWSTMTGIAKTFQASPHAHSVNFDPTGRFALACDKGANHIYVYRVEADRLVQASVFKTPTGTAPRHAAFHPTRPFVVVVDELIPNVTSYAFDHTTGTLQRISTAPTVQHADASQTLLPADIHFHPNGRFVYTSTRRADILAVFGMDDAGRLTPVQYIGSGGKTPRTFNVDPSGRWLMVGGQDSNNIVTFAIDATTGKLTATGVETKLPRPVCIKFAVLS